MAPSTPSWTRTRTRMRLVLVIRTRMSHYLISKLLIQDYFSILLDALLCLSTNSLPWYKSCGCMEYSSRRIWWCPRTSSSFWSWIKWWLWLRSLLSSIPSNNCTLSCCWRRGFNLWSYTRWCGSNFRVFYFNLHDCYPSSYDIPVPSASCSEEVSHISHTLDDLIYHLCSPDASCLDKNTDFFPHTTKWLLCPSSVWQHFNSAWFCSSSWREW